MIPILLLTITSCLLSLLLTPLTRDWSRRFGLVDRPDHQRKIHAVATPRTGGIPILAAYAGVYVVLPVLAPGGGVESHLAVVWRLLPAVGLVFVTGLLDDWLTLRPWQKLTGQLASAVCAYAAGVRILGLAGHPLAPSCSLIATVGWLILCCNAFNLIDGVDGLAAGVGFAATLTACLVGVLRGDLSLALVTAPLAGSLIGFLRYNFNPASIFLGDSGSLLIGFLLGAYSIVWVEKSVTIIGFAAPAIALGLPLLEVGLSVVRRFLRNEPIFAGDRGHIHHTLLDRGFTPRRVALVLYGVCGLGALFSLLQSVIHNWFGGLLIMLVGLAAGAGIHYLRYAEFTATSRFLRARLRPMLGAHVKLEMLERSLASSTSVEQCWGAMERAARALGYSQMTARLDGRRFSSASPIDSTGTCWQMRLNLPGDCFVNITQSQGSTEEPILVIPFVEIVGRILPGKMAKLNDTAAEVQRAPVNSRTRTVISSDCAAPSVNAATAS